MLGGGIGVTFGSQKQTTESDQTKLYAKGSQVGSLNGNTTMIAENTYTQTASKVSAIKDGDVNILAKKVDIKAADDKYETNTKQKFEQKGLTIAITSPVISAIQAAQGAVQSTRQVGESKHGRVNAMAAANAGFDAYRAADSVMNAGDSIQKAMSNSDVDSVVGVQITYGQQKSESRTHTEGKTAAKSQVNADGKVNIMATGVGKNSNINIEGSDISGKQGTTLIADNQVNIKATEQNHQERSTNKSSGFNAGVAIKVSNGAVAGATLGGNSGKGYGNGDETTYVASHVGDSQSKTVIHAGGDANIIGSQVKGKRVELNAENLNIESLQDTATYKGKQMNASGSVTVGYGASVGGSFNKSKINADHASINEQAGIYAGDEGYDINVNKHTDLKGALITSTQKAEADGKNHFSTDSITHSDIENHSNYSGSSFGVSGSVSANFETPFGENGAAQSTKQATDKDGNLLYTDKNGNTTVNSKGVDGKENTKKLAEGKESLQFSYGMGYGKDSDSQSSTTKSGINTQNIIIKDEAEQLKRTGKTVQEEIAAIKTDITTESAQSQSGKLENRFNKDDVQKELDFQREVTEKFGPNVAEAGSLLANKFGEEAKAKRHEAAIALEEAEKAKAENNNETNRALVKQARDNFETASREAKEWETGGSQRLIIDSALNVISTALAGRPAAEVVASGLSPAVNNQIKKATTDAKGNVNTALNLTAHALWGAVEAYAGNRNVAAGAAGAAGGEAAAHFLASTLYDKSPEKLSEEEKRTVSSLSQVAAGIAGGTLSDSSDGAIIAAKTAKDAVENNYLYNGEVNSLVKELAKAEKEGKDTRPIFEKYAKLSEKNRRKILKDCGDNPVCYIPHIQMMQSGDEAAYENSSYLRFGSYFNNLSRETQVKLSDFVELENGKTRNQLPKSVHYATLALGAAEAVGLGGLALKTKLPKGANANEVLPVIGKTKGYDLKSFNHEAHNFVNYEKYKQQLRQENLDNIAKLYPELSHAALGKNNFTYKDKKFTKIQSDELGRAWVGPNYEVTSQGGFISEDGTRRYRPATSKKNSSYAETGIQSNFERFYIDPITGSSKVESNLHLNIYEDKK